MGLVFGWLARRLGWVRDVDFGAREGVAGTIRKGGGGVVLGVAGLCGRGVGLGGAGPSLMGGGMAPSDESSDSKCHLQVFLSPVSVTGSLGDGGFASGGGGVLFTVIALVGIWDPLAVQQDPKLHL